MRKAAAKDHAKGAHSSSTPTRKQACPGIAFAPDTPWQKEFEASFALRRGPDDQLRCIAEIKRGYGKGPLPMERLLCGDVGFGKTEVALRAAM